MARSKPWVLPGEKGDEDRSGGTAGPKTKLAAARWGSKAGVTALTAVSPPSPPPPDEALWCRTTRALREDEAVCAFVVAEPPAIPNHHAVKAEPGESPYPAALHSDIQLLPQQAGMAAILATAVVNSESSGMESVGRGGHTHTHGAARVAGTVPGFHRLSHKQFVSLPLHRGRLSVQRLRDLVPERAQPASPPDVLLRQPAKCWLARPGGEAQGDVPQRARLPLPSVQEELPQRQLLGDPHAEPQRYGTARHGTAHCCSLGTRARTPGAS